ncbi:RteC domain-containing protein [Salegentibacter sp. F188]|uniref:RteC domain-containing protein n=1 Tax=Autumnicola patrickiae TaxID=3075591 RepID=A0ABU3E9C4_9FLAO|nr:RteC domain-containing protein [Salegentibacter sp. F188]MDT0691842.1 RteC domain-containing protein [Salegentibacter sp. F188]
MTNEIQHILDDCKLALDDVNDKNLNEFSNVEKGIKISRKYLQKLRVVLRKGSFINKENEILFFKKQKPFIYGQLKFYAKLYKYLLQKPRGTDKSKRNYLDAEIKKLQEYYYYNSEFIKYYRQNATFLDEFYFLRGNDNIGLMSDTSHFYTDAEFSTSHDNAVAKILAYDLLLNHYTNELNELKKSTRKISNNEKLLESLSLTWTSNKIDLIELIYSLIASGAVKGDIKDLATAFEKIFDIDLGNYYRSFLEIRGRKEDYARFLDLLKISLLKKIKEADN